MKKCMSSYFGALVQVLRGNREGAAVGKAVVAILILCVALLGLSLTSVKVWAACSDYFAAEELELPFVCTELADYPGGETAYIFGFGFEPGEEVELQVVRTDGLAGEGSAYEPWLATADADGNVATFWIVCTDCVDTVLRLYAYGLNSDLLAETIFSDAITPAIGLTGCSPYSQNFDSLASSGTSSTTPSGWGFVEVGGTAPTTYTAGTGSGNAGDTYSFGVLGANALVERAFGGLRSGTVNPTIGAQFINNSGQIITALKIQYMGEQWRLGATGRADSLQFQYSVNATALNNGTWTAVSALDFTAPVTAGTVGALDGNASANRTLKSATISGLSIANGATFFIRWVDTDAAGADDGLGVDDFVITPLTTSITTQPGNQTACIGGAASFNVGVAGPTTYAWRKRGNGFGGGWTLNAGSGGFFMGSSTGNNSGDPTSNGGNDINTSGRAWGVWNNSGTTTEALRPLNTTLAVGQTFSIDMDNGNVASGKSVGFGLLNGTTPRFEVYFAGGDANYTASFSGSINGNTGIGFTRSGINIQFTLLTVDTFSATVTRYASTSKTPQTYTVTGTLKGTAGTAINQLRFWNYNAGADVFFNNISFDGRDDNAGNAPYSDGWATADNGGQAPLANGGNISGATSATLTISPVGAGDIGSYDVVVGTCPQTVSSAATLSAAVDTTPPVVSCPAGTTVEACSSTIPNVLSGVTASDNCGAVTLAQNPTVGTSVGLGTHTITVTATDGSGNSAQCTTTYTVRDTTSPVVTCPTFPPITPGPGCVATVPDMMNMADSVIDFSGTQGQGGWWYGSSLAFDAGSFTTLLGWDGSKWYGTGCYSTPYLTVSHGHPGVGGCDGFSSWRWAVRRYVAEASGTFRIKGEFSDGDLGCNSGDGVTLYIRQNNADIWFNVTGTGWVPSWNINPNDGTREYWLDVTVNAGDRLDFAIAPRSDQGCDDTYWTHNIRPLVTDNCGINQPPSAPVMTQSPAAGTPFTGSQVVTLTATDAAGNVGSCTTTLLLQDTTPPTITCPGNVTVTCASDDPGASFAGGSATDNCGTPTVTVQANTVAPGACANKYVRTVTFLATDAAGNTATCTRIITVNDTVPPTLGAPGADATIQCPATPFFTAPSASDNCGSASAVEVSDVTTPGACAGTYSRTKTWKAVDVCGNESASTVSQTITVVDTTSPTIGAAGANATIECPATPVFAPPAANDTCGSASVVEISDVTTPGACAGTYSRTKTWKAVDGCGNESGTISQTITVQDTTAPAITCPANAAVGCNDSTDPSNTGTATAIDSCGGTVTINHVDAVSGVPTDLFISEYVEGSSNNKYLEIFNGTGASVDMSAYNVAIYANGATTPSSTINLSGTLANGAVYVIANSAATLYGGTIHLSSGALTFNGDDAVALRKNTSTLVDVLGQIGFDPGTEWGTGLTSTADNTILRRNTIITGDTNGSDAFNPAIEWTGYAVDTIAGLGAHSIAGGAGIARTWTATDACGNSASCVQTITISDTVAPVLSGCPTPTVSVQCIADVPAAATVTATDDCDAAVTVQYTQVPATLPASACNLTITRTWTAADSHGNSASCTQTITVNDTTVPILTMGPIAACYANAAAAQAAAIAATTASDNCGDAVTLTASVSGTCNATVTVTGQDSCNNSASVTYSTRIDGTAPVLTKGTIAACFADAASAQAAAIAATTASDDCGGTVTLTASVSGTCSATMTVTGTDSCGNAASVTYATKIDSTAPVVVAPANATLECPADTSVAANGAATATDNCDSLAGPPPVPPIWINEFHYDNASTDVGEFIEIAGVAGFNLNGAQLVLYNGSGGAVYNTLNLSGVIDDEGDGYGALAFYYPVDGIQNGSPDGIALALSFGGSLVHFLSYEGTFTAVGGPAAGQTSTDVGVAETTSTPIGYSVQLLGDGTAYGDFVWTGPFLSSPGSLNAGQTIQSGGLVITYSDSEVAGCGGSKTITRTWTAMDACGNSANDVQTIMVVDTLAPVLASVPADATVSCDAIPTAATVTATDACEGLVAVTLNEVDNVVEGCGTIVRTWTATDACGNSTSASQTITVQDTVAPVLAGVPADETVECDAIPAVADVTASDDCDPTLDVQFSEVNNVTDCAGTIIRTWTVADSCGNSISASQNLTVIDTTPPDIQGLFDNEAAFCDAIPAPPAVSVTDNCDTSPTLVYNETSDVVEGCGTIVRTWTATDAQDNTATKTQTVDVTDLVVPELVGVPADATVECDAVPAPADVTATDNCDPTLVVDFSEVDNVVEGCGTIVRTWTVEDNCGNSASASQTITVEDTVAPVLAGVPADETVECTAVPAPADVTASDACDPTLVVDFSEVNSVVEGCGTIVRTWTVTDSCGNSASASQTITVQDTVAPVLAGVPADETVECTAVPAVADVTAADDCDPTLVVDFSEVNSVVEGCGTIVRTWTVADSCGNSASASQTITVQDTLAPVLAGVPTDETVSCEAIPAPADVTAADACDPTLVVDFSEVNSVVEGCGTIVRTWTVADSCGNSASASQTITVQDTVAPVLAGVPADETVSCEAIPAPADVTASDACDPTLVVDFSEVNSVVEGCGTIVRTWTVADSCGNSATASQTITVEDTVAPVLSGVPADETAACDDIPDAPDVTATDNCDPTLVVDFSEVDNVVEGCGTIVRTWTVEDSCGNSASASQTITVEDTVAPVLAGVPADASYQCPDDVPTPAEVTATDTCDPTLVVDFSEVDSRINGFGTIIRTWTVEDNCGNSASADQTITVLDTTAPVIACAPNQTVAPLAAPAKFTASVELKFHKDPILAGTTIWFSSILKVKHEGVTPTTVGIENSVITFTANGVNYSIPVPDGIVYVQPVASATTTFGANGWETTTPKQLDDHVFLVGVAFPVPVNLPGNIVATWTGDFTCDRLGVTADWKAGAAVYTSFSTDYNALGVKPVNGDKLNPYLNHDKAGTPENFKAYLIEGATGKGKGDNHYTGRQTGSKHVIPKKKGALMSTCDGIVVFTEPTATDNCGGPVDVTCDPPSGTQLGAGVHVITCTAVDESGNSSTCTYNVTVLSPLRIVITDKVKDDNVSDEIETDQDILNKFKVGSKVEHRLKLYDCTGTDVTEALGPSVTVRLDVSLREYINATTSVLINDLPELYDNWGSAGGIMELDNSKFRYDLLTTGYPAGTIEEPKFFRSRITVEYNSSPGVIVAEEDALLESNK